MLLANRYTDQIDSSDSYWDEHASKRKKSTIKVSKATLVCYSVVAATMFVLLGMLIDRAAVQRGDKNSWIEENVEQMVLDEIKTENIRDNLRRLTMRPHPASSKNDEEILVNFIQERWKSYLDKVEVYPYDVLLSFPNMSDPNYIALINANGTLVHKSNWTEKPVSTFETQSGVLPAFNAFSPMGHVEGHMFFVNYGSVFDYEELEAMGVNVTGGICIVKYGHLFRGDKAKEAERRGCLGLIIYSDPMDYGGFDQHSWDPSEGDANTYPNTWWLPSTGFQRGSLFMNGDPLTPDYPALSIAYRIPEDQAALPKIPVQPISYEDAYRYISVLGGKPAPDKWQGGFKLKYRTGGSFVAPYAQYKAQVHVSNYREIKTVHTIIGYLQGWQEPDRYVLLGNHRDAWTFGGADPNSGTAVVLEVSRALAAQVQRGKWRPRRTLVFCNWAAEEYGLIGSTEWVEQMEKRLMFRAVAYVNTDTTVSGSDTFEASATPELASLIYNSTKSVPNPVAKEVEQNRPTVYETWLSKNHDPFDPGQPQITNLGSGSDFTTFLQKVGISAADIDYTTQRSTTGYPVYHSIHDTFEYMEKFMDPDFNVSQAVGRVAGSIVLRISDSATLPFRPLDYANKLNELACQLQNTSGAILKQRGVALKPLMEAIAAFNASAKRLTDVVQALTDSSDPLLLRRINDKLQYINRGFLDYNGVPGRHQYRHVIFAPSSHDSYGGACFPGITDTIFAAMRGGSWEDVKQQVAIVSLQILSAANLIDD